VQIGLEDAEKTFLTLRSKRSSRFCMVAQTPVARSNAVLLHLGEVSIPDICISFDESSVELVVEK